MPASQNLIGRSRTRGHENSNVRLNKADLSETTPVRSAKRMANECTEGGR
jgi:hypothetical protein